MDRAAQEHGLATPLGFLSEVGVAGLTLGGGLGYLTRRFGWTVDNLLEVEIVTADGRVRRASRDQEPELFWAVRGAGANLGAVTSFTFRMHPVGPAVVGGLIAWPFARAEEIHAGYRALTDEAPRELAAWLVNIRAPAAPFVPPAWHGERVCAMSVCFSGDLAGADAALAPIRALGEPVFDLLPVALRRAAVLPGRDRAQGAPLLLEDRVRRGALGRAAGDLPRAGRECPIPDAQIGLLHLGGALNERAGTTGRWATATPASCSA